MTRHRLPLAGYDDTTSALGAARDTLAALSEQTGYLRGWITRAVDDADLLVVAHEWVDAGSYRRALSAYDVKLCWPFLLTALDEATAFEVLVSRTPESVVERPSARRNRYIPTEPSIIAPSVRRTPRRCFGTTSAGGAAAVTA